MRSIRIGILVAAAAAAWAAAACSPTAPESAESVIVLSGDSQTVSVNAILPDPIEVQVLNAAGRGRAYAQLYWTIGRLEGGQLVPAGNIVNAFASADRDGRATGEFQVAGPGTYKISAVAKVFTDANGVRVTISATATVFVTEPITASES